MLRLLILWCPAGYESIQVISGANYQKLKYEVYESVANRMRSVVNLYENINCIRQPA